MNIPPPTHAVWSELLTGKRKVEFEFLAARMLIVGLRMSLTSKKNPIALQEAAKKLQGVFALNATLPVVQRDIENLGF